MPVASLQTLACVRITWEVCYIFRTLSLNPSGSNLVGLR